MAASIIREDIRSTVYELNSYPSPNQFMDNTTNCVPKSLTLFLSNVCDTKKRNWIKKKCETKYLPLAHSIISFCRPRSFISPILLGLGLYLHRNFGTKGAIDIFSNFGFCSSYTVVYVFETSSLLYPQPDVAPNSFSQFVFDNADFNISTLDGYNTFHTRAGFSVLYQQMQYFGINVLQKLKRQLQQRQSATLSPFQ